MKTGSTSIKALYICVILCMPIGSGCGGNKELRAVSMKTGSNLGVNGRITDESLEYVFDPYKNDNALVKDLFNYIYFQGDTLCFSFQYNRNIENSKVDAFFIDPLKRKRYRVERLECNNGRVYGFSLVGSLLDVFFLQDIKRPVQPGAYNHYIPFEVLVRVDGREFKYENKFRIRYQ